VVPVVMNVANLVVVEGIDEVTNLHKKLALIRVDERHLCLVGGSPCGAPIRPWAIPVAMVNSPGVPYVQKPVEHGAGCICDGVSSQDSVGVIHGDLVFAGATGIAAHHKVAGECRGDGFPSSVGVVTYAGESSQLSGGSIQHAVGLRLPTIVDILVVSIDLSEHLL
jgi:hypothetical protein